MMSEKQYKVDKKAAEDMYSYILKNEIPLCLVDVVDLLNSFSNAMLAYDKQAAELKKENEQLREKNKQIGFLKRDLFILLNLVKDTPAEHNLDYIKIKERWE